jgi:hypothetical protein
MRDNESAGLLVRIVGEPEGGVLPGLTTTHTDRECRHDRYEFGCAGCKASNTRPMEIKNSLREGEWAEPFWAIHRTVEVLGKLDTIGHDMRKLATMNSIGALTSWWKLRD